MIETTEYPRVLYHVAIKHRRNAFGRVFDDEIVHAGDFSQPNYPMVSEQAKDLGVKGKVSGAHLDPQLHYKTMIVAEYNAGGDLNLEKSAEKEKELFKEGWRRHPDQLKEEYED